MERNHQVIVQGPRGLKVKVNLCRTEEQFKNVAVRQLKEKIWEKFPDTSGHFCKTLHTILLTDRQLGKAVHFTFKMH
uniref:Uncharacterized protein n=1 Tax=Pundamilia nyererei TaxID=303518 RepID=A0A3B4HCE0_9CICH